MSVRRKRHQKFTLLFIPQDGGNSKTFSFSTSFIGKSIWIGSVLGVILLGSLLYFFVFWIHSHNSVSNNLPGEKVASSNVQEQLEEYRKQIEGLRAASVSKKVRHGLPALSGIASIPLAVEELKTTQAQNGRMKVRFRLVNKGKEDALSGYIVLLRVTETGFTSYPNVLNEGHPELIDFRRGEHFRIRFFREVLGEIPSLAPEARMHLLVYSDRGELVFAQRLEGSR